MYILLTIRFNCRYARNNASLIQQSAEVSDHMSSVSRRLADIVKENSGTLETLGKNFISEMTPNPKIWI